MIEQLLSITGTSGNGPVIPDSGPGPQKLVKYDEVSGDGYFGLTSTSELFTVEELEAIAATPLPGTPINRNISDLWGKYVFEGKILYIPRAIVKNDVSWADLYNAGFVYGTDDTGKYPFTTNASFTPIPLTPVNQLRTITKTDANGNIWTFKVRLVRSMISDPNSDTANTANIAKTEYARTIERTIPTQNISIVWARNGNLTGLVHAMETRGASGGLEVYQLVCNGNTNALQRGFGTKQVLRSWLPVVELTGVVKP